MGRSPGRHSGHRRPGLPRNSCGHAHKEAAWRGALRWQQGQQQDGGAPRIEHGQAARRWHCQQPACPRSSFTESTPQIPPRKRVTSRLRASAGHAVALAGRTVAQATAEVGLSWPVVHAAFLDHATALLPNQPQPLVALGIDETRRGKPRFTHDTDTGETEQVADRWHTGFVNLTGEQGLLGQVEGRSAADAGSWLAARTQQWREGLQVLAIDMCSAYRAAVRKYLPHATLVVDHFHVVQLANQMVSSVRRRVTATLRGRRVRRDDPEYGVRRRLLRNREDLAEEKFADMWNRLVELGPAGNRSWPPGSRRKNCARCWPWPGPVRLVTRSPTVCGPSTDGVLTPIFLRCTVSPRPFRHGGHRETEISWIRQLTQGLAVARLAERAGYSERMMFRLLRDLYQRWGVANRTEAIIHARDNGWL